MQKPTAKRARETPSLPVRNLFTPRSDVAEADELAVPVSSASADSTRASDWNKGLGVFEGLASCSAGPVRRQPIPEKKFWVAYLAPNGMGRIHLHFENDALSAIDLRCPSSSQLPPSDLPHSRGEITHSVVRQVISQLDEYFAGKRKVFDFDFDLKGEPFDQRVWEALKTVPYGTTVSYGELATLAGAPGAARAVGSAVGRNPVPICVPCHRVISADGTIGGFSGGLPNKQLLLDVEHIVLKAKKARGTTAASPQPLEKGQTRLFAKK